MLKIYNTLGRELQEFKPIKDKKVSFYQCGPTVYWVQHIGVMRAVVLADLVRRSLGYLGYNVTFVRNYTDVGHLTGDNIGDADTGEDRMEKGAKREGITPMQVADKYIRTFESDIAALNVVSADHRPRATAYIPQMISLVQTLLDKGYAYTTPKAVYFDVSKVKDYGKLSGQNLARNIRGAGKGEVTDPDKKRAEDFALWFFRAGVHKNALQYWASPFSSPEVENGVGFPGWHVECSAMSSTLLGETLDIHMGGVEHVSIHHTNEIAQSESVSGKKFVNYWIHNEHLLVNGAKMAKSEGTAYSVADIVSHGYEPLALRYFFLQAQYRSKQNFTWEALDAADKAYKRLRQKVADLFNQVGNDKAGVIEVITEFKQKFVTALEDDFNIPQALVIALEVLKADAGAEEKLATILDFDRVLGLKLESASQDPEEELAVPEAAKALLEERAQARAAKDWERADRLRDLLRAEFGVEVEDTASGQKVRQVLG